MLMLRVGDDVDFRIEICWHAGRVHVVSLQQFRTFGPPMCGFSLWPLLNAAQDN